MSEKTDQIQESATAAPATLAESESLLDSILKQTKVARSDEERERAKDLISELITEALNGTVRENNTRNTIK